MLKERQRNFPFNNCICLFPCAFVFSFLFAYLHFFFSFPCCLKKSKWRRCFKDVGLFLRTLGNYCVIKNVNLQFSPLIMFNCHVLLRASLILTDGTLFHHANHKPLCNLLTYNLDLFPHTFLIFGMC